MAGGMTISGDSTSPRRLSISWQYQCVFETRHDTYSSPYMCQESPTRIHHTCYEMFMSIVTVLRGQGGCEVLELPDVAWESSPCIYYRLFM